VDRRSRPADRLVVGLLAILVTITAAACFGSAASPTPTPVPTPSPTPDPHLREPAAVGEIYQILRERGLGIIGTNARAGDEPRTTVVASYAGWPLVLAEFSSTKARMKAIPFENKEVPKKGQAPYLFAGLNLAVEWGPADRGVAPPAPDAEHVDAATKLANELNRLVGPIGQRAVVSVELEPIERPTPAPPASLPAASPSS
jgi:hypothetical protein